MRFVNLVFLVVLVISFGAFSRGKPLSSEKSDAKCGYNSCNQARAHVLNVHVVSHSHDDVGWLKTVDQYYYGVRNSIQKANVNNIITSVVEALQENPERRFIQVETAFFKKWWDEQSNDTKDIVHKLVENGQLDFVGGAWSMNDEAAVHYQSIIDQFTLGLRFLNETFGECGRPKAGWQIDPFGHSKAMAEIFAQLGYDGIFFARLDWRDKGQRLTDKNAEFIWKSNGVIGNSDIFTSVLYNHYNAPAGFCFDILCNDAPIITQESSSEYNFEQRVKDFASFINRQAQYYKTNNIIITMGDDFNYQDALYYYRNLDTLIRGFKVWPQKYQDMEINIFYSTPSCYIKAVHDAAQRDDIKFSKFIHDFFPYASDYHAYWTGYFSSRPTSKRSERLANNLLQIHKQLSTQDSNPSDFFPMQNAVGIMQHHDAITGTEKQHVADDYAQILDNAFKHSEQEINKYLSRLLANGDELDLELKLCLMKNATICKESHAHNFNVVVYNPVARSVDHPVRLPVNGVDFEIIGTTGGNVEYQVSPTMDNFTENPSTDKSIYELTFIAENLPPLGYKVYQIRRTSSKKMSASVESLHEMDTKIGFNKTFCILDFRTGLIKSVTVNGNEVPLHQELLYYLSAQGNNQIFENRASGAYIFRTRYSAIEAKTEKVNVKIYRGSLYHEAHQWYNPWVKQIVRIYNNSDNIELDWIVGPIPIQDNQGKEIISRFSTDFISGDAFITDSNGRENIIRGRDIRYGYNYTKEEPIAGNYYPVTTQISIKDNSKLTVLTDRAQGGSSLKAGDIELMVHRRMLYDDAFGVGEALNETEFGQGLKARGTHYLTVTNGSDHIVDKLAEKLSLAPWVFLSEVNSLNERQWKDTRKQFSGLTRSLPDNVKLLSLEPLTSDLIIMRFENHFKSSFKQTTVDLNGLFTKFEVLNLSQTTLGANEWLQNCRRFNWNFEVDRMYIGSQRNEDRLVISLLPTEIKTFIAKIKRA